MTSDEGPEAPATSSCLSLDPGCHEEDRGRGLTAEWCSQPQDMLEAGGSLLKLQMAGPSCAESDVMGSGDTL